MNWINKSVIPDDNMIWNVFNELKEQNLLKTQDVINKHIHTNDIQLKKVITLYKQCNDLTRQYLPVEYINMIYQAPDIITLQQTIIDLFTLNGITNPNMFYVYNDMTDSNMNILHIGTGGLGLPDRDYYFNESNKDIRDKYKQFMIEYLRYFNLDFDIEAIYCIEHKLAESTYTNVMKRNVDMMNNPVSIDVLKVTIPPLASDLEYFFKRIQNYYDIVPQKINMVNPNFTKKYYDILYTTDLTILKQYFIYLFLRKMGNYIDINTETILFNFYGKVLSGIKKMKEPWKRTINTLDNMIGFLVGKMFVTEYFNEASKNKVIEMIEIIRIELKDRSKDIIISGGKFIQNNILYI
jgi:predicted metalloendopeptidase